jgi:membrane-bound lytic murein transglycosylase B
VVRRALVAALAAAAVLGAASPATAATASARPLPVEALGTLSPALAGVPASGPPYERAWDAWDEARTELTLAQADVASAVTDQAEAEAAAVRLDEARRVAVASHERAAGVLGQARSDVVDLAVAGFMDGAQPALVLPDQAEEAARAGVFGEVATDRTVGDFESAQAAERGTRADAEAATELARAAAVTLDEARTAAAAAEQRRADWASTLERSTAALTEAASLADLDGTDLTIVTVDAYVRGAAGVNGCVDWAMLAGIGRIETRHGTYRGSSVDVRGDATPRIVGIPLDGSNATMAIGDTDGGALDGDPTTDRAVGPMQFIPSTWRTSGLDGNGDGVADPNNLYDAAAAAARYLCRAGGVADPAAALFSYNRSVQYGVDVTAAADRYRQLNW